MKKLCTLFAAGLLLAGAGRAQTNTPTFASIYQRKIPAWFNEAKFGVFIVWGVYSVPGWAPKGQYAEWYGHRSLDAGDAFQAYHDRVWGKDFTYDQFVPRLTGEGFDQLPKICRSAGFGVQKTADPVMAEGSAQQS